MGSQDGEDLLQGGSWRTRVHKAERMAEQVVPHLCADKPKGTTGEQDRPSNPGFQCGEIKPQNL